MNPTQKVAVITGASQGIGAALVTAYRKLGYAVVANSRWIAASEDPDVLAVPGDLASRGSAAGSRSRRWRGSAGSTPWSTTPGSSSPSRSPTTPTRITTRSPG